MILGGGMTRVVGILTKPHDRLEPAADKPRAMEFPTTGVDKRCQDGCHN